MVSSRLHLRRFGQLLRSECGQSLVLAMIVMSALTISIGALISYTTGNEHQFGRDLQSTRAFHVAEAGVNNGLSLIVTNDAGDASPVGTKLGPYPVSLDGATGSYTVIKHLKTDPECKQTAGSSSSCWVITGSATSPNGTITRTLQETAYWLSSSSTNPTNSNYGLVVDNQGGVCVDTHGTVNFTIRDVWISGDFCPSGNVSLIPPAAHTGSVYIGGVYQGKNNTSIGTSSLPYANVDIVGGCTVQGSPQICSNSASSNVWSDGPPAVDPSSFQLPVIDAPSTYASGNWSSPQCSSGSFTFDNDGIANGSAPTVSLMPSGASFNCTVNDSGGNPVGHLAWNNATQQLSISGTIWIDGSVNLSNSGTYVKDNVVPGSNGGTIFVNGTVSGASNITVCGPISSATPSGYGCPGTWDPTQGMLGLVVVNPLNSLTAFDRNGNGELDMEILVNQGYANTGGTTVMGPVLADTATMGGNGGSIVPTAPPTGFPSVDVNQATWVVKPGSWSQTQ